VAGKRTYVKIDPNYSGPSRVWTPYVTKDRPFPCYDPSNERLMTNTPASEGILFQRPEKTGTTTMVGIVMRLAHNRAARRREGREEGDVVASSFPYCRHRAIHGTGRDFEYSKRNRQRSFLFSLVRDPTSKAISRFFHFSVTVYQRDPTDANFISDLQSKPNARSLLNDLVVDPTVQLYKQEESKANAVPGPGMFSLPRLDYANVVREILDEYDFIAVTERMDESLVVMKFLLNLTLEEILYIKPARSSGSFSNGLKDRKCVYIHPTFITRGVANYLQSGDWKARVEGDELLYQAAYKSLDRTIDYIGRDQVERDVSRLKRLQRYATEHCEGKVRSMCDDGGRPIAIPNRTCYIWGEGCDYQCLNSLSIPPELLANDDSV
jgi:hypothetical protein